MRAMVSCVLAPAPLPAALGPPRGYGRMFAARLSGREALADFFKDFNIHAMPCGNVRPRWPISKLSWTG